MNSDEYVGPDLSFPICVHPCSSVVESSSWFSVRIPSSVRYVVPRRDSISESRTGLLVPHQCSSVFIGGCTPGPRPVGRPASGPCVFASDTTFYSPSVFIRVHRWLNPLQVFRIPACGHSVVPRRDSVCLSRIPLLLPICVHPCSSVVEPSSRFSLASEALVVRSSLVKRGPLRQAELSRLFEFAQKKTRHVFQTAGDPPSDGKTNFAAIG
jgi:hypothetical protein